MFAIAVCAGSDGEDVPLGRGVPNGSLACSFDVWGPRGNVAIWGWLEALLVSRAVAFADLVAVGVLTVQQWKAL